jgi:hypothetical protein
MLLATPNETNSSHHMATQAQGIAFKINYDMIL